MAKKIIIIMVALFLITSFIYRDMFMRLYEGARSYLSSESRAKYYRLTGTGDTQIKDITQNLIADKSIPLELKEPLIKGERHILIFKYLSGSDYVAGYFSYLSQGTHPVLIFLRGGNGYTGIMRPNNRFSFLQGYNVVGTLYRGNIYGGKDELGGSDLEDVENLIKFFPQLENFSHVAMQSPYTMMGVSRGAMEMFLALSESDYVKSKVDYAISVSGNIDLNVSMKKRPEMAYLFRSKFHDSHAQSFDAWMHRRNPVTNVEKLPKTLKVLLIYGLSDKRVSLDEQENFKQALEKAGINSRLVTVPYAEHGFDEHFNALEEILAHENREKF